MEPAAPALSRRHEAGAPSARGMLLTLLGEFVLSGDGTAWTSAVLAVFARLGVAALLLRFAMVWVSLLSCRRQTTDDRVSLRMLSGAWVRRASKIALYRAARQKGEI